MRYPGFGVTPVPRDTPLPEILLLFEILRLLEMRPLLAIFSFKTYCWFLEIARLREQIRSLSYPGERCIPLVSEIPRLLARSRLLEILRLLEIPGSLRYASGISLGCCKYRSSWEYITSSHPIELQESSHKPRCFIILVELGTPAMPVGVGAGEERGGFHLNLRT